MTISKAAAGTTASATAARCFTRLPATNSIAMQTTARMNAEPKSGSASRRPTNALATRSGGRTPYANVCNRSSFLDRNPAR